MYKAILIMGPPGAGKGTQAELLAYKFNLIHFDVGRYLEFLFQEGRMPPKIHKEFKRGDLLSPAWTLKISKEGIKRIASTGFGMILSGSLRTVFEAFGGNKSKGVMDTLIQVYGKKNIVVVELDIPSQITLLRNSKRKICSVCWKPHLLGPSLRNCPFCGGKLIRRVQDRPVIIRNRLKEYEEKTKPVIRELKRQGFKIIKIDGRPKPETVFKSIMNRIK